MAVVLVIVLALAGALLWLWRRVDRLEHEFAALRDRPQPATRAVALPEPRPSEVAVPLGDTPAQAASEPEPDIAALTPEPAARGRPSFDFEDLFGRLLPIWAGGVTLAVAGFFLVRWSIDAGLLTPPVRVLLAGLFGAALIGGAEAAYRWRERVADPRVAQALAGAGLATLYAAFYLAGTAYGLIGSTLAFLGLAAVTAAAIALSYRFGLPSAVLGLVGGFAAPALVGSEQANLVLLTLYLALVTGGLALTGRRQDRSWLGVAALVGSLAWGALLTASGPAGADAAVLGVYLVLIGAVIPAIAANGGGRPHWLIRIGAATFAALQLAVLVNYGGFGALQWSLYLLLGAALAWFGWREPAMREASAAAGAIAIALLTVWPAPPASGFAVVAAAVAAIFAGPPLVQIWRGHRRPIDVGQVTGIALGIGLAAMWHFGSPLPDAPAPLFAAVLLALAALPAAARYKQRRAPDAGQPAWSIAAEIVAALLAVGAVAQVVPQSALPWTFAAMAALLAWRVHGLAGAVATVAAAAALWALLPLMQWLRAGTEAVIGAPLELAALPAGRTVILRMVPTVVGGLALAAALRPGAARRWCGAVAVAVGAVAAHILFRHAFGALAGTDFVGTGVIARASWQALLLAAAWLTWSRAWRVAAFGLNGAALGHFVWFSLLLHDPLWSVQAVGALPVLNALLPAFGAGLAILLTLRRWLPGNRTALRWAADAMLMAVITVFALSLLRQCFAGSLLSAGPVSQGEDLLRSLLGIVLAIGFLLWGARRREQSWRIGSLVLMVIAVLKVFLIDAAGLAGLGRIASFMALGFSLIGIGWFYSRQLRIPRAGESTPQP